MTQFQKDVMLVVTDLISEGVKEIEILPHVFGTKILISQSK